MPPFSDDQWVSTPLMSNVIFAPDALGRGQKCAKAYVVAEADVEETCGKCDKGVYLPSCCAVSAGVQFDIKEAAGPKLPPVRTKEEIDSTSFLPHPSCSPPPPLHTHRRSPAHLLALALGQPSWLTNS